MKKILVSAMIIVAMASCSKELNTTEKLGLKEIVVNSVIDQTKAALSGASNITGLQFLSAEGASLPGSWVGKVPFSGNRAGATGVITMNSKFYYNENGTNTYLTSYYPAGTLSEDILTWTIDGKTDILTAAAIDKGNKTTPNSSAMLSYKHQLCQIEVLCKVEKDADAATIKSRWGQVTNISLLDTPSKAVLDYNTLLVNASTETTTLSLLRPDYASPMSPLDLQLAAVTASQAVIMVYPQTTRTFQLKLTMAGGTEGAISRTVTIDLGEGKRLERAKKHVVTLTFKKATTNTEIEVAGSASNFEEWGTGTTGSGSIQ